VRQTIAILLFLCITVPVVGTYGWLSFQKHIARKAVKRQLIASIDKAELVQLKFSVTQAATELRWEHSKEFEYKGEMYDVVQKESEGDSVTYWCWWDHEETKLNKHLGELVSDVLDQSPERNKHKKQLLEFFKSLYFAEERPSQVMVELAALRHYPGYSISSYQLFPTSISPPPELL
jgi:hypothetical protein